MSPATRRWLRLALRPWLLLVAGTLVIGIPVLVSWRLASRYYWGQRTQGLVRLKHVVAATPLERGVKLTRAHLEERVDWLPEAYPVVPSAAALVGQYPRYWIAKDSVLAPDDAWVFAPGNEPGGGPIVTVEVRSEHGAGLKPGARLAFARYEHLIPPNAGSSGPTGLLLLSVAASTTHPEITVLTVEWPLEPNGKVNSLVSSLATGEWRPVVLKR